MASTTTTNTNNSTQILLAAAPKALTSCETKSPKTLKLKAEVDKIFYKIDFSSAARIKNTNCCSKCNKTPKKQLKYCQCTAAQYCNSACQNDHWKTHRYEHRRICKTLNLVNTEGETKDYVEEEELKSSTISQVDSACNPLTCLSTATQYQSKEDRSHKHKEQCLHKEKGLSHHK